MEFEKDLNLLNEFPPPSMDEWKKVVEDSLKGADFNKVMFTKTYEGITLKPIYTKEDTADLPSLGGQSGKSPWLIAQNHDESDLRALNAELLKELMLGLTAVNITLKHDDRHRGVRLTTIEDLRIAFEGVDLQAAPLFMQLDVTDKDMLPLFAEYMKERGIAANDIEAGIGFDPTSEFARKGYLSLPLDEAWINVADSVTWAIANAPGIRCLSLDGSVYEAAGASSTQELAFVLSTAIGYIQALQMQGFEIDQLAPLFQVKLTLGSNIFMEIAKIRAFRLLWAEMIRAFGGSEASQKIWIHGKTARFNKSTYDIYVNALRTSTEGFAGVIGGVDSLEIDCFNEFVSEPDDLSRRMARNIQVILKEETHFDKVIDPAGGCYYVESLTNEIAEHSWKLMQELEANQGMIRSLIGGKIHDMIEPVALSRIEAVHRRKDVFVGVNMFANVQEADPDLLSSTIQNDAVKAVLLERGALKRTRAVADIELLRAKIAVSGLDTRVFLLNMGTIAEYKARADFGSGFLQVGGLEVISPSGFTNVQDAVEAARASGASAFCICSTDDNYQHLVPQICQELRDKTLILAGFPAGMTDTYKEQGIDLFIHLKADVYQTLSQLAVLMGVTK